MHFIRKNNITFSVFIAIYEIILYYIFKANYMQIYSSFLFIISFSSKLESLNSQSDWPEITQ